MKQSKQTTKYIIIANVILAALVLFAAGMWWFIASQHSTDERSSDVDTSLAASALFSFDTSAAPDGWFETIGGLAFSPRQTDGTSVCHVSANYENSGKDEATWLQEKTVNQTGYTVTPSKPMQLKLATTDGDIPYTLHQHTITPKQGVEPVKEGVSIGYAPLPTEGFITLTGICDKSSQLPGAIAALQAFRVDTNKPFIDMSKYTPEAQQ